MKKNWGVVREILKRELILASDEEIENLTRLITDISEALHKLQSKCNRELAVTEVKRIRVDEFNLYITCNYCDTSIVFKIVGYVNSIVEIGYHCGLRFENP